MNRLLVACAMVALTSYTTPARADVIVTGYEESSVLLFGEDGTPQNPIVPPGGMSGVVGPAGITYGPDGLLYVSNQTSVFVQGAPDSIVAVDPTSGAVATFITLASGYVPAGLAFGPDGDLYVCQNGGQAAGEGSGTVDHYDGVTGAFVESVVTHLTQPTNILFDANDNLYISNFGDGSIVFFDGTTASTLVPGGTGNLAGPAGIAFGPLDGNLYVVDLLFGAVRTYDPVAGSYLGDFISDGGPLDVQFPASILFDDQGNALVACLGNSFTQPVGTVKSFDSTGAYVQDFASNIFGASQLLRTQD